LIVTNKGDENVICSIVFSKVILYFPTQFKLVLGLPILWFLFPLSRNPLTQLVSALPLPLLRLMAA